MPGYLLDFPDTRAMVEPMVDESKHVNAVPQPVSSEATAESGSSEAEVPEIVSAWAELAARRRRNRHVALALIALSAMTVLVWSLSSFQVEPLPEPLGLAPRVLWEEQLNRLREEQSTVLEVRAFRVNDELISELEGLDQIETLIIDRGTITDRGIDVIASLPNLRYLRLRQSPITDDGLCRLSACKQLWYLNLPQAECTAAGVATLSRTTTLRQLRLGSPKLSNDVSAVIAQLRSLRGIHLIGLPITDEGLKAIASLPHLESLYLDDAAVTDAGWTWLFHTAPHLHIHVNQQHHDRDPHSHPHHPSS